MLILGCGARSAHQGGRPQLVLRTSVTSLLRPNHVVFYGRWVGDIQNKREYYCPAVHWMWGDGEVSSWASDCEPFGEGTANPTVFTRTHLYRTCGEFHPRLVLVFPDGRHVSALTPTPITVCPPPSF